MPKTERSFHVLRRTGYLSWNCERSSNSPNEEDSGSAVILLNSNVIIDARNSRSPFVTRLRAADFEVDSITGL